VLFDAGGGDGEGFGEVFVALGGDDDCLLNDIGPVSVQGNVDADELIRFDREGGRLDPSAEFVWGVFPQANVAGLFALVFENDLFGTFLADGDVFEIDHGFKLDIGTGAERMQPQKVRHALSFCPYLNDIFIVTNGVRLKLDIHFDRQTSRDSASVFIFAAEV